MKYYVHWDFGSHHEHESGLWDFPTLEQAQAAASAWEEHAFITGVQSANVTVIKGEEVEVWATT